MAIMTGIRLSVLHEGMDTLMYKHYGIRVKDMSIYDDPAYPRTVINLLVYREGTVYSGYLIYRHLIDSIDITADRMSIGAKISEIPKIIWNRYKIKHLLGIRY